MTNSFMLQLASEPKSISEIEPYVNQVVENYHVKEDVYGNILISLTEAVNNAIIHGNKEDSSKKVVVSCNPQKKDCLAFRVQDEGPGFDFDEVPDPTAPENIMKPGGRGIFLMKQLSDSVEFHENGKVVEIQFKI